MTSAGLSPENVVTHFGFVPTSDIPLYFGAADLSVYPYLRIDQSASLMLSMTLGTPSVVTDIGGLTEVVTDGVHGQVVPPANSNAIAAAVIDLLSSRARLDEMGRAAREMALQNYSWRAIAARTNAVYEIACARREARSSG